MVGLRNGHRETMAVFSLSDENRFSLNKRKAVECLKALTYNLVNICRRQKMNKKIVFGSLSCAVAVLAIAGAASFVNKVSPLNLEAAPVQTTRRIWAIDNTNTGWFYGTTLYCHLNTAGTEVLMTQVLSDYYGGLFYADIASDETAILFKNYSGAFTTNFYNQTDDVTIKDNTGLLHGTEVYYINQNSNDGKCPVSEGTAPMSNAQLAETLRYYGTCDADYCYGYLAYPFVKALYDADNVTGKDDTAVSAKGSSTNDGYKESNDTTIGNKVTLMGSLYNAAIA
jgi:hypothetical protein